MTKIKSVTKAGLYDTNPINKYLYEKIPELKNVNADIVVTNRGDRIEIDDLFIDKKGTGLGTKIVKDLENLADQQGKFLQVNKAYNKGFWSKFGFDEIDANTLRRDPKIIKGVDRELHSVSGQTGSSLKSNALQPADLKINPEKNVATSFTTTPSNILAKSEGNINVAQQPISEQT